ncbi:MAG TPA: sugar nucleotide-binding protein [Candidatus Limnocylindrales bacterium]|nr:sugar nucleotide-binding protein [Candidatus Limnocylindrales bacterium]
MTGQGSEGRVAVLGHRGMLGSVVARVLRSRGHAVDVVGLRYRGGADDPFIEQLQALAPSTIVNCLGVVSTSLGRPEQLMAANGLLPQHVAAVLPAARLIHASTDCVFDGKRGWYSVDEPPNSVDAYGLSKRIGEACVRDGAIVLRTSIVGPPGGGGRGLLGWFLGQQGSVDGWVDHRWNGITTLEWALLAADIIDGTVDLGPGVHHPTTVDTLSKFDMLHLFAEAYDRRIDILQVRTGSACDRTLAPTLPMPPLLDQLRALRAWESAGGRR